MLQAELKILGGKHQGKAIPLSTKKFLVGREQDCQLRPNSDLVSRHHCVFSIDDYAIRLRDLGSTNGTRVNGKALHGETILKSGDQIGIGKLELELVIRHRADSEVAIPAAPTGQEMTPSGHDSISATATVEMPFVGTGNDLSQDTSYELPVVAGLPPETSTNLASDTTIIPNSAPQPAAYPGYAPIPAQGYPAQMPQQPGYGPMPGYGPPMGYPQPGYPPQQPMGYPGYPQYPQGYPQAGYGMPAYPMATPYGGGYQMPAGGAAVVAPTAAEPVADAIGIRLPPPESTGVKTAPPPAEGAAPAAPKPEEKNTAADIIKSYMQRRR